MQHRRMLLAPALCVCLLVLVAGCTLAASSTQQPSAVVQTSPCTPCPPTATPTMPPDPYPGLTRAVATSGTDVARQATPDPHPVQTASAQAPTPPAITPVPTSAVAPLPTIPLAPLPSPTPLPLRGPPAGDPPDDLHTLLYAGQGTDPAQVRALRLDTSGRVWGDDLLAEADLYMVFGAFLPSPDGRWLAAEDFNWRGGPSGAVVLDLQTGTLLEPLPEEAPYIGQLVGWDAGGRLLLTAYNADLSGVSALCRVDVASGDREVLPLAPAESTGMLGAVAIDPERRRLIYALHGVLQVPDDESGNVWLYDLASGQHEPVGSVQGRPLAFVWSPDGEQVAFLNARYPGYWGPELAILDLVSGTLRAIGSAAGDADWLAWSPDGSRLAFVRHDHEVGFPTIDWAPSGYNLYVLDVASGAVHRATEMEGMRISSVVWLPDGEHLALSVWDLRLDPAGEAPPEIRLVDVGSGEMVTLARPAQQFSPLAWLPAGE